MHCKRDNLNDKNIWLEKYYNLNNVIKTLRNNKLIILPRDNNNTKNSQRRG